VGFGAGLKTGGYVAEAGLKARSHVSERRVG
jgi:hypothetical protein